MIKFIALIKRKPGLTDEEFYRHWKEKHGPLAARVVPGLRKYIQDHPIMMPGVNNDFDGIAELWFDDVEAVRRFLAWYPTDKAKVLHDDEDKFVDRSTLMRYIVNEYVMK